MNEKDEIRTLDGFVAVRECGDGDEKKDSRTIYGRAIVFNAESELLDENGMRFREIIRPEAVTMDWLLTQDIKMNMLHDRKQTVARWNKGKGSLRLGVDDEGVTFEFDAPRSYLGDHCLEMVRRGDYSGCSFEFRPKDYDVERRGGEKDVVVKHRSFNRLSALTIGLDPAYRQTSVSARELYEQTPEGQAEKEAAKEAERQAAEQKAAEERERQEKARREYEQRKRLIELSE